MERIHLMKTKKTLLSSGKVTSQSVLPTSTDRRWTSGIGHQEDEGEVG